MTKWVTLFKPYCVYRTEESRRSVKLYLDAKRLQYSFKVFDTQSTTLILDVPPDTTGAAATTAPNAGANSANSPGDSQYRRAGAFLLAILFIK